MKDGVDVWSSSVYCRVDGEPRKEHPAVPHAWDRLPSANNVAVEINGVKRLWRHLRRVESKK